MTSDGCLDVAPTCRFLRQQGWIIHRIISDAYDRSQGYHREPEDWCCCWWILWPCCCRASAVGGVGAAPASCTAGGMEESEASMHCDVVGGTGLQTSRP